MDQSRDEADVSLTFEPYVMAKYDGKPWLPDGIRLSAQTQCTVAELMQDIHGGRYRRYSFLQISAPDKDVFRDLAAGRADTYGELMPEGFMEILWRVGAKRGERFYDLGAGTGKLTELAWLMGLQSTGIELSETRWRAGCRSIELMEDFGARPRLPKGQVRPSCLPPVGGTLAYLWGDIFDLNFEDADIIFVSTVMFSLEMIAGIARRATSLKPGTRIVSAHDLSRPGMETFPELKTIGEYILPSSWSNESRWYVHTVTQTLSESDQPGCDTRKAMQFPSSNVRVCRCSNDDFYPVIN